MRSLRFRRNISAFFCVVALAWASSARAETIKAIAATGGGTSLITFDSATPGTLINNVGVAGLAANEVLLGIDFRPASGELYGLGSTSQLYRINAATGAATPVGGPGGFVLFGFSFGFDFNPLTDRIRVTSDLSQNIRLNPNTGALSVTDSALNPGTPIVFGSAYTNNFAGASTTTLYDLDALTESLFIQSPANAGTLSLVGPLGVDVSALGGFDISGPTGITYAALTAPGGNASQLFTIDLTTGSATLVGTIGSSPMTITGLAAPIGLPTPVPEPAALTLMSAGAAALVRRRRMGQIKTVL